ncbi:unnamed protein product [Schistosoma mattheei]|uniref:Uncharacterized protein n=1 Tax=Schistosoma mattheei TaxID=31246 RepID=A0A3P8G484_9TREM|nr:unnamed protein product [Schistosoma mattheei]
MSQNLESSLLQYLFLHQKNLLLFLLLQGLPKREY